MSNSPDEWIKTYPKGLDGTELYSAEVNGYRLEVVRIKRWFYWTIIADENGRYVIGGGRGCVLKEAQELATTKAKALAPGLLHSDNLLPSEKLP